MTLLAHQSMALSFDYAFLPKEAQPPRAMILLRMFCIVRRITLLAIFGWMLLIVSTVIICKSRDQNFVDESWTKDFGLSINLR